jgi:hypothetical protein
MQLAYGGLTPFAREAGGMPARMQALIDVNRPVDFKPVADPNLLEAMKLCLEKRTDKRATVSRLLLQSFIRQ